MRPTPRLAVLLGLALGATALVASADPASRHIRADQVDYRVVDIDLGNDALELRWKDASGHALAGIDGLRIWGQTQGRDLLFAANAGIYDREFRPLGLHVEDGAELRPLNTAHSAGSRGNFSMQPNGVFYVDRAGNAGVVQTGQWRDKAIDARIASQSGPLLLVDGEINPNFDSQSESAKLRSGVCASAPHRVVFAISEAPVTFHAFARLFRDELGCRDALYLDGTISRLWTKADGYAGAPAVMVKPYVGMFAVFAARE